MALVRFAAIRKIFLLTLCISWVSCARTDISENRPGFEVIVVRIPPLHDPSLTPLQNYSRYQRFLFPRPGDNEAADERGETGTSADLPNDDSLIHVRLSVEGEVFIGRERQANLEAATRRLCEAFKLREENGVFEPESDRIVKAVGISIPNFGLSNADQGMSKWFEPAFVRVVLDLNTAEKIQETLVAVERDGIARRRDKCGMLRVKRR